MKKIANTLKIAAIILTVGPFFGITLKGFSNLGYLEHLMVAAILFFIGFMISKIHDEKEINNTMIETYEKREKENYKKINTTKTLQIQNMDFQINYSKK